jgi:hypothetical protein
MHTYNPSYSGNGDQEDLSSRPNTTKTNKQVGHITSATGEWIGGSLSGAGPWAKSSTTYLKNNKTKKGWRHD